MVSVMVEGPDPIISGHQTSFRAFPREGIRFGFQACLGPFNTVLRSESSQHGATILRRRHSN
jgi:hypothetical protein